MCHNTQPGMGQRCPSLQARHTGLLLTPLTQHQLPSSLCSSEPPQPCRISSMSEVSFLLVSASHVDLILAKGSELKLVEAAVCSDQRNGVGAVSASHTLSLVDQGRWGREALGSIQPKTCGLAKDGYYNDDIYFQRRPEECGGCDLGHIPTPASVYLHSFSLNIQLSLMVAIKKSSSICSYSSVKTS